MTHPLVSQYGDPVDLLTGEPQSADMVYRKWAGLPDWKSLTRRERGERRWLGERLERLANRGVIHRDIFVTDYKWAGFWVDARDWEPGISTGPEFARRRGIA